MENNTKYPGEIVGYIYRTTDYDAFKKLTGNRDIFDSRRERIASSIKKIGWVRNPIVVNEKMEVVDGQGRTEALESLGMPIEYVVAEGATIDHCIALNLGQKNWGIRDFVESYANQGDEQMIQLRRHIQKYGNLPISAILEACVVGGRKTPSEIVAGITGGTLRIYDEFTCDDMLLFISECVDEIGRGKGRIDTWAHALKVVFLSASLDCDKFKKKLIAQSGSIKGVTTQEDAMRACEMIYNYGTRDKVYFAPIAARIRKEKWEI